MENKAVTALLPDERLDEVNEDISLIQKKDGLTFGTDAYLLAAYMSPAKRAKAAELGAGTGIISLLCAARERFAHIDALEIQPEFAELIRRNVSFNQLDDRVRGICADVRESRPEMLSGEVDVVFSNPPYMRTDSGKRNESDKKYIARHEVCGGIGDFCGAARRLLKHGGKFYCVWRPDRLSELIRAMNENSLALKRLTFVHADKNAEPSMVLVSSIKGGAEGCVVTKPLFLFDESLGEDGKRKMSAEAEEIYATMSFDGFFGKK